VAELAGGDQRFRADSGSADPAVAAALAAFADGSGSEHAALTALAGSRLLVPVVAVIGDEVDGEGDGGRAGGGPADGVPAAGGPAARESAMEGGQLGGVPAGGAPAGGGPAGGGAAARDTGMKGGQRGGEKRSDMAMPTIVGRDGRRALPAFTCLQSLSLWQPAGRPVPVPAAAVWQSAVNESSAVVIDIAGPVPIVVDGARLTALAGGGPVPWLHEDLDVWQLAAAVAAEHAPGIRVRLSQPRTGLDLTVELAPPATAAGQVPDQVAARIGEAISMRLADRAPRGIAVVTQAATDPDH
jgi:hypothetical protein